MANINMAKCPKCGKVASGLDEVKKKFGLRNNNGYICVQSWCKVCRSR